MPRNSKRPSKAGQPATSNAESEEADWYASPEGQRATEREFRRAVREGMVKVYPRGQKIRRTDPKALHGLLERARANMTKAISIRIPLGDLEAAKRIAERRGTGYQAVLKEIIHKGLAAE
jgi:predicted DNA binding CopG/RHH family protein